MKRYTSFFMLVILLCSMTNTAPSYAQSNATKGTPIGQYVVETFEDSKGNLWFGTLEKGVAKYDGTKLQYLTMEDGLPSNRIVGVIEDANGDLWFGTDMGICRYDGETFTTFSEEHGLISNLVSVLFIDSKGVFWVGTWGGVSQFDGRAFHTFTLPNPMIDTVSNQDTKNWITTITEDRKGTIWFGRDGYGATQYNGREFKTLTKKDGLYSNNVQSITEDDEGNLWFGTRVAEKDHPDENKRTGKGGLHQYDGKKMVHFPSMKALSENDVYEIYKDPSGVLWISSIKHGVYRYSDGAFKNYPVDGSTMSMLKDRKGTLWIGCAGGLFKLTSTGIVNVTTAGPWN